MDYGAADCMDFCKSVIAAWLALRVRYHGRAGCAEHLLSQRSHATMQTSSLLEVAL